MSETNRVPFLDLVTLHREIEDELVGVFKSALRSGGFVGGAIIENFESEFAEFCDTRQCVGVGSGTDALRFALTATGIRQGDIAVTVPNSFIATTEAITQAGAQPVFVDVDERTATMDPLRLEEYLQEGCVWDERARVLRDRHNSKRVAAIIPVHLYGHPADMDRILELAERFHLTLIEDACQAHGAEYYSARQNRWFKAGSMGKAAAFSFYPGKNLGACGEAGAVTTNDADVARKVRMLRDHGQAKKYFHDIEGYNGRIDAIQAGFLRIKLQHLTQWNHARRAAANRYGDLLNRSDLRSLAVYEMEWARSVYHLYVIRVKNRETLMEQLNKEGIGTAIHYPVPLHLQKAYKDLGYKRGDFPVTEAMAPEILSLPMFPQLTAEQQERVVSGIEEFAVKTTVVVPAAARYASTAY